VAVALPDTLDAGAERARRIADEILFPIAQDTDVAAIVPRSNLDALRDAGLDGLQGPDRVPGGLGASHAEARPVLEAVAGGCGSTAFVWAQHHGGVRRIAGGDGPAVDAWLPRVCDGSARAGIGFAYLRRPGPPAVQASPEGDGWRLRGRAPWITGWGLIDVLVLMARADDGRVVTAAIDRLGDRPELQAGEPQRFAAMSSTGTVGLRIDDLAVRAEDVVGVQTDDAWRRRDAAGSAMPPAAPLGIADRAIRLLGDLGGGAAEVALSLTTELETIRAAADRCADDLSAHLAGAADRDGLGAAIERGARERDRGLAFARRATDGLVAGSGGRGLALTHPAQRLSREATFYLIQAQTAELRLATLARVRAS
jgi:alkylation response protein AidB-like acyl-CoA dehydrogenase